MVIISCFGTAMTAIFITLQVFIPSCIKKLTITQAEKSCSHFPIKYRAISMFHCRVSIPITFRMSPHNLSYVDKMVHVSLQRVYRDHQMCLQRAMKCFLSVSLLSHSASNFSKEKEHSLYIIMRSKVIIAEKFSFLLSVNFISFDTYLSTSSPPELVLGIKNVEMDILVHDLKESRF